MEANGALRWLGVTPAPAPPLCPPPPRGLGRRAFPAGPSQLEGSFPRRAAGLRPWETLRPRPSSKKWRDKGGAREGAGGDLVSDPAPTPLPPPRRGPSQQGLRSSQARKG